jgi:hypothetical protein
VSQSKTEAMRVARQLAVAPSTEAQYSAALEHKCEFCGKAFERESNMHQYQTGHCPTNGKPWCSLAHREQTKEAFEVELILDVRGAPERGRRFYLVKWMGFDGDPMEESTWETAEDLAKTAAGVVDDFWAAHPELDRYRPREVRAAADVGREGGWATTGGAGAVRQGVYLRHDGGTEAAPGVVRWEATEPGGDPHAARRRWRGRRGWRRRWRCRR